MTYLCLMLGAWSVIGLCVITALVCVVLASCRFCDARALLDIGARRDAYRLIGDGLGFQIVAALAFWLLWRMADVVVGLVGR